MRLYLDTSVLVAMLVREAGTAAAQACLAGAAAAPLLVSRWTATELSSALALKLRMGWITAVEQEAALAMFRRLVASRLSMHDPVEADFDRATRLCDQAAIPLRAGDALHMAVAKRLGARLITFDAEMAAAARYHGLAHELLTVTPSS
ncbi:MAG: type II toxin-antitoxin system VapC family toxin [Rhodocyclaceae bacterium]|nr:type II toxin-antitoxin system VapC family toxin [Rhodocyclaceae bacterium]